MTVEPFVRMLKSSPISSGASWMRADFHVHAPGSSDYEYKGSDAAQRLANAINEKLCKFAIILKHQEFPTRAELAALQKLCPTTTLIPGAEINVFVDALFKKIGKDYFFHCIVAVNPEDDGEYDFILRSAKDTFTYKPGEYPAGFRSNILDLGRFFRERGALFIPAHLHQAKSPENSRSIDDLYDDDTFLSFVKDGAFDALEVRDPKTARFFDGTTTTKDGRLIPAAVCVASSDAHHHDHIAQRARTTWVQAETATFEELKACLTFRHRIALNKPELRHARVLGVHVKGSFISEVWAPLNEGLNALIGAKGSGKTALIECIRFALNTPVPAERRESVARHVNHVLGSSGYVECLVVNSDGARSLITRRADAPDRITVQNDEGEVKHFSTSEELPFPISILGWHEIEAVADQPDARIALLDRIGEPRNIKSLYGTMKTRVELARDQLPVLQRQIKKLQALLSEMWELQRKRQTLHRLQEGELLTLQQQYEWYLAAEQKIAGLTNSAGERRTRFPEILVSHISVGITEPPATDNTTSLKGLVSTLEGKVAENALAEESASAMLESCLGSVQEAAGTAASRLSQFFSQFRDEVYTPKVNALPAEDREILTRQIQVLEETKRLPLVEKQCDDLLEEVRVLCTEMAEHCDQISHTRADIIAIRSALIADLNKELSGVQLTFMPFANQTSREKFRERYGEEGANLVGYMQGFGKQTSYENLAEAFRKLSELQRDEDKWSVNKVIFDVKFVEMLDVIDDDDMQILLHVGKAGFVPIQNLSAGQRCVAVFPLLLRNTKGPLVIDQPEDNLDNRYIADIIGPDLLSRKCGQQFLVTSHNANLVVLTDADLIIHVDSDGAKATFPASGFLSCSKSGVKKSVLDVLDGGEHALTARQRKYGTATAGGN